MFFTDINAKDSYGRTALHKAAANGNEAEIVALIAAGANIHAKDEWGGTPLRLSAYNGHKGAMAKLIAAGADVNSKDIFGGMPLDAAAYNGKEEAIAVLIAAGADVNAKDSRGYTALHMAAFNGHEVAIAILIAAGANIEAEAEWGETPLHKPAFRGFTDAIEVLIAAGANINAKNKWGETPLYDAALGKNKGVIEVLIAAGTQCNEERLLNEILDMNPYLVVPLALHNPELADTKTFKEFTSSELHSYIIEIANISNKYERAACCLKIINKVPQENQAMVLQAIGYFLKDEIGQSRAIHQPDATATFLKAPPFTVQEIQTVIAEAPTYGVTRAILAARVASEKNLSRL